MDQAISIKQKPHVTCGECTACCTALNIASWTAPRVNKLAYASTCRFCKPGHKRPCTVYDTRPDACRDYECAYTLHSLKPNLRPDRSGFIINWRASNNLCGIVAVDPQVTLKQFLSTHTQKIFKAADQFAADCVIVVTAHDDWCFLRTAQGVDTHAAQSEIEQGTQALIELFGLDTAQQARFVVQLLDAPTAQGPSLNQLYGDPHKLTAQQRDLVRLFAFNLEQD